MCVKRKVLNNVMIDLHRNVDDGALDAMLLDPMRRLGSGASFYPPTVFEVKSVSEVFASPTILSRPAPLW